MNRRLSARLGRLEEAVTVAEDAPVCRFHGTACRLGRNWPLPYEPGPLDELLDLHAAGRRAAGMPVSATPRELWAVERHELVPPAELAAERAELGQLIAEQKAVNAAIEAELIAGNERGADRGV